VLRRVFGPKEEEVAGDWRRLHNKKLHNLYTSPNIIKVIKPRTMRLTGHVAYMGEMRNVKFLVRKSENYLELLGIDGRILLEWILKKYVATMWTGFIWWGVS
jgi:hypothetical protein